MSGVMTALNNAMMGVLLADPAPTTPDPSGGGGTKSGGFDILQFLDNATSYMKQIGHYIMLFAGVILIIVATVQIAKGLAGGGRGQVNWVMSIACLLVGGILLFGGWNLMTSVARTGADTLAEMGGMGSIGTDVAGGAGDGGGGQFAQAKS